MADIPAASVRAKRLDLIQRIGSPPPLRQPRRPRAALSFPDARHVHPALSNYDSLARPGRRR